MKPYSPNGLLSTKICLFLEIICSVLNIIMSKRLQFSLKHIIVKVILFLSSNYIRRDSFEAINKSLAYQGYDLCHFLWKKSFAFKSEGMLFFQVQVGARFSISLDLL